MGHHAKPNVTELDDSYTVSSVGEVKKLSGKYIAGFSGDNHNDSVRLAYEWMEQQNLKKGIEFIIELVDYYPQYMTGAKSILISYNRKPI